MGSPCAPRGSGEPPADSRSVLIPSAERLGSAAPEIGVDLYEKVQPSLFDYF